MNKWLYALKVAAVFILPLVLVSSCVAWVL